MGSQAASMDLVPRWLLALLAVLVALPMAGGWLLGTGLLEPLFLAVLAVVAVLALRAVYADAVSQGMDGAVWVVVVLLLQIVGLVIYLAVRSRNRRSGPS